MREQDKEKFITDLTELASYYNRKLPPIALRSWWTTLKTLDIASVSAALETAIATERTMPTPEEVLKIAGGNNDEKDWETITREIGKTRLSDMNISHKSLAAALEIGGHNKLAYMKETDEPWVRKAFLAECRRATTNRKPAAINGEDNTPVNEEALRLINRYTKGK